MRRVRDNHQRDSIYKNYFTRIGDLVSGKVKDRAVADIVVDLGNGVDAILRRREQSDVERWLKGDLIRAVITKVIKDAQYPQDVVELSRLSVFLRRLFEREMDEISGSKVVVKAAGRAAGGRSKIAVMSTEPGVDPVALCLAKDSRIRAINHELRGEKIEVIEWSDDPTVLAVRALAPAKINEVRVIDTESRTMDVIVSKDQLELAEGKRGANHRAASELVGWRIHIMPEDET